MLVIETSVDLYFTNNIQNLKTKVIPKQLINIRPRKKLFIYLSLIFLQYKSIFEWCSEKSSLQILIYGVTHESILGPFLFLIMVNELLSCVMGMIRVSYIKENVRSIWR